MSWYFVRRRAINCAFIASGVAVTVLNSFFEPKRKISKCLADITSTSDFGAFAFTVVMIALFSGVEVTVGSTRYAAWMGWSCGILLLFRYAVGYRGYGPSFLVFAPYMTFACIHKPYFYFKLFGRITFSDHVLYAVGVFQYICYHFKSYLLDFSCCLVSNMIFNGVVHLLGRISRRRDMIRIDDDEQVE